MLYSWTNFLFGKIFDREIWVEMFSANQIAGFSNQPYLHKKSTREPYFLHVDTNSHKLKVGQKLFKGDSQKWAWPVWSCDSKIDCISRMTRSNERIFCMLVQFQEN